MTKEIKVAIVGVGNCTSSFYQGIELFKSKINENSLGVIHPDIKGRRER